MLLNMLFQMFNPQNATNFCQGFQVVDVNDERPEGVV
jgi:hypothetical protein